MALLGPNTGPTFLVRCQVRILRFGRVKKLHLQYLDDACACRCFTRLGYGNLSSKKIAYLAGVLFDRFDPDKTGLVEGGPKIHELFDSVEIEETIREHVLNCMDRGRRESVSKADFVLWILSVSRNIFCVFFVTIRQGCLTISRSRKQSDCCFVLYFIVFTEEVVDCRKSTKLK